MIDNQTTDVIGSFFSYAYDYYVICLCVKYLCNPCWLAAVLVAVVTKLENYFKKTAQNIKVNCTVTTFSTANIRF